MTVFMSRTAFVLVCLAYEGHARQVQERSHADGSNVQARAKDVGNPRRAFARVLLTLDPTAFSSVATPGESPGVATSAAAGSRSATTMRDVSLAVPRRAVLCSTAAALAGAFAQASYAIGEQKIGLQAGELRGLDQEPVIDPKNFAKLASGTRYADLKVGSGPEVTAGSRVSLQWVLRRSNGYFVDSSIGALASGPQGGILKVASDGSSQFDPFIFTVGDGKAIKGVDDAVRGMKQGGVRKLIVPIKTGAAYTNPIDKSGGPLPSGFGPRRQIERELAKQDPYNYFAFEISVDKVTAAKT